MQIKIDKIKDDADLDYLKRRIEALYFEVNRFGDTLIVSHTSSSMNSASGFRLARLLHQGADVVSYTLDETTARRWQSEETGN